MASWSRVPDDLYCIVMSKKKYSFKPTEIFGVAFNSSRPILTNTEDETLKLHSAIRKKTLKYMILNS